MTPGPAAIPTARSQASAGGGSARPTSRPGGPSAAPTHPRTRASPATKATTCAPSSRTSTVTASMGIPREPTPTSRPLIPPRRDPSSTPSAPAPSAPAPPARRRTQTTPRPQWRAPARAPRTRSQTWHLRHSPTTPSPASMSCVSPPAGAPPRFTTRRLRASAGRWGNPPVEGLSRV